MHFSFVYLDGCFYERRAACRRYRCVCVSRAEHNGWLIVPLDPFVLFCFVSFSLSLFLSRFSGLFSASIFFFFLILPHEILFCFFLNKPSIIELYENSNSLEFNIIAYHNFMRFIIFTIELSIVNLILSKQIYVLT